MSVVRVTLHGEHRGAWWASATMPDGSRWTGAEDSLDRLVWLAADAVRRFAPGAAMVLSGDARPERRAGAEQ